MRAYKQEILNAFVVWMATPAEMRDPMTLKDFARIHGVSQDTLTDWKRSADFWGAVRAKRQETGSEMTSDVLYGFYRRAAEGKAAEVKLWLQYFMGWGENAMKRPDLTTVAIDGLTPNDILQLIGKI